MIYKIGPFEMGQPIDQLPKEEFMKFVELPLPSAAEMAKNHPLSMARDQLKDVPIESIINSADIDKMYETTGIPFMGLEWNATVSVTESRISGFAMYYQAGQRGDRTTKGDIDSAFKKVIAHFESQMGKAHKHPFGSKLYVWYFSEGWINVEQVSAWGMHEVGFGLKLNRGGLKNAAQRIPLTVPKPIQPEISQEKPRYSEDGTRLSSNRTLYHENGAIRAKETSDGICEEYYESGKILRRYESKRGKQDGLYQCFHENGTLSFENHFKDDKAVGPMRNYHENGRLSAERFFLNEKEHGVTRTFYENGILKSEVNYVNGKKEGLEKIFFQNEQLAAEAFYRSGRPAGQSKSYYESGKLMEETDCPDGNRKGKTRSFYESGKLKYESCEFEYDDESPNEAVEKRNGTDREFYESGKLLSETPYVDGLMNGITKRYYENGQMMSESPFKDGSIDGVKREYFETGTIKSEEEYAVGCLVRKSRNAQDGNPYDGIYTEELPGEHFPIKKLFWEENYKNGLIDGWLKLYGGDERELLEESEFKEGIRHGKSKFYRSKHYYGGGHLESENVYFSGRLLESRSFDYLSKSSGDERYMNSVTHKKYDLKTGKETESIQHYYSESGAIKKEETRIGEKMIFKDFYESGQLEREAVVEDKKWITKRYSENGNLVEETPADENLNTHGTAKQYYENGNNKSEGSYVHGNPHGVLKQYGENGRLIAEITYKDGTEIAKKIYDESAKEKFDNDWWG